MLSSNLRQYKVNIFTIQLLMENKITSIKDRVVQIAEKQYITKESFFKSIGMTSANFRGKAKETPLNSNAIVNIITKYPDVDLHWLLTGEEKKESNTKVSEPSIRYDKDALSSGNKDEIIAMLRQQVKDLKADKEDLKKLLGLSRGYRQ